MFSARRIRALFRRTGTARTSNTRNDIYINILLGCLSVQQNCTHCSGARAQREQVILSAARTPSCGDQAARLPDSGARGKPERKPELGNALDMFIKDTPICVITGVIESASLNKVALEQAAKKLLNLYCQQ